jgi:hypothetical protein
MLSGEIHWINKHINKATKFLHDSVDSVLWHNWNGYWSWTLLENPPVVKPLDRFPAFYGNRSFITAVTRALLLSLSRVRPIQSTPSHPISPRSIPILFTDLRLGLPSGLFPSDFPTNNLHAFFFSPFVLHARLDHSVGFEVSHCNEEFCPMARNAIWPG